jgi:hypothetical protein
MLTKSSGAYTEAQVEAALRADDGKQQFRWRFAHLDKERNLINSDLKTLQDGTLDFVRSRRVRTGAQFKFIKRDLELDDYSTLVLASSPIFYWQLGDTSGTTAQDSTANNRDGTYQNTPSLNVESLLKGEPTIGAVRLDGSNDYISTADNAAYDVATLTVEFVMKTTSNAAAERIIERDDTDPNRCWVVYTTSGTLNFRIYIGGVAKNLLTNIKVNDGLPHHVACTYDGAYMRVFIDGAQIAKQAQTGSIDSVNSGINVGSFRGASNFFTGTIARVAVYGAALPAPVIKSHYQSGFLQLQEIDFSTERIKIYLQMLMADGGYAEWPRGEFLLGFPVERGSETGTRYEVLAYDKLKSLDDYGFENRYVIGGGTLYTAAISALLALVYLPGEYSVSTSSTATLPATTSFQVGDNLLDAVIKLATAINYGNPYSNAEGNVIVEEYVKPEFRAVDDFWDVDNGQSFLSWERELSSNYNETKNYVIAKSVNSKNGIISRAISINNNSSHPTNIGRVGRRTFLYEVQAADSGTLQQIADRKKIEVSMPVERFNTQSVYRPYYENEEKIAKLEDGENIHYVFDERHTSLSGQPPFMESYSMIKVYLYG